MLRYREMGWTNSSSNSNLDIDVLDEDMQEAVFSRMLRGLVVS